MDLLSAQISMAWVMEWWMDLSRNMAKLFNIITGFAKGAEQWRAKDQHFMFGSENKGASLKQFAKTIESGLQQQRTHS